MSFKITNELPQFTNTLNIIRDFGIPVYSTLPAIQPLGNIIYLSTADKIYLSNGIMWQEIMGGGSSTLPPPLQSISSLSTNNDTMLYTTAPDTYATTTLTPFARTLLNDTSSQDVRTTLETIKKPLSSIINSIATFNGTSGDELLSTNVIVSGNDVSNINNLTFTGNINTVSTTELSQLATIDTTIISSTAWSNMSLMDQNVSSTSSPTFAGALFTGDIDISSNKVINLGTPVSGNDATPKSYVDSISTTSLSPIIQGFVATTTILPNNPIYAEPDDDTQTFTSTAGAGVTIVVDGFGVASGRRILVKDQVDPKQNGIYTVIDSGQQSNPWQITRSTDFNQAYINTNGSIPQNTYIFITTGISNPNTSWILANEVSQIRPAVSATDVLWVSYTGSETIIANDGLAINQVSNIWGIDSTNRFAITANQLELNTVIIGFGGTQLTSLPTNSVLIGNNTSPIDTSKSAPSGDFVGTTDTQTLTNKTLSSNTNTIITNNFWSGNAGSIVNVTNSPTDIGQELLITSIGNPNTAEWLSSSTFFDNTFVLVNSLDITKIATFEVDNISSNTTRTYRLPNVNEILAYISPRTSTILPSAPPWISAFDTNLTIQRTSNYVTITVNENIHDALISDKTIFYDQAILIDFRISSGNSPLRFATTVVVNSVNTLGVCQLFSDGTIEIFADLNFSTFPLGGTAGHRRINFTYFAP